MHLIFYLTTRLKMVVLVGKGCGAYLGLRGFGYSSHRSLYLLIYSKTYASLSPT